MYMNKAVLYVKLKGPQCSDIQGAQHMISMQKKIFLVALEQKLGAMGHQALLEHSFEEITQILHSCQKAEQYFPHWMYIMVTGNWPVQYRQVPWSDTKV